MTWPTKDFIYPQTQTTMPLKYLKAGAVSEDSFFIIIDAQNILVETGFREIESS